MNIIKKSLAALISFVVASAACDLQAVVPGSVMTQTIPAAESVATQDVYPNDHGKSLTTPVAWGAGYGSIYFGVGFTSRVPYRHGPAFSKNVGDGAYAMGFGIGNPVDNVGLQTTLTQYDLSAENVWGMSFQLSRYLSSSKAIAVGTQEVMLSKGENIDRSYYFVYSQAVESKPFINTTTGKSKLHYSIGVGNGIYGNKQSDDIITGKGEHGTYVFGNLAYELFNEFNVVTDWNGINWNAGIAKTFFLSKSIPLIITAGAADLTSNSGDGARMIVGVGSGITF